MLDGQESRGVVDGAVAIVVVADRAVEQVVAKDAIEGFPLCTRCARRGREDQHSIRSGRGAGSDQAPIDFHHAGVAGLDRAKLWVIANLGNPVPARLMMSITRSPGAN